MLLTYDLGVIKRLTWRWVLSAVLRVLAIVYIKIDFRVLSFRHRAFYVAATLISISCLCFSLTCKFIARKKWKCLFEKKCTLSLTELFIYFSELFKLWEIIV